MAAAVATAVNDGFDAHNGAPTAAHIQTHAARPTAPPRPRTQGVHSRSSFFAAWLQRMRVDFDQLNAEVASPVFAHTGSRERLDVVTLDQALDDASLAEPEDFGRPSFPLTGLDGGFHEPPAYRGFSASAYDVYDVPYDVDEAPVYRTLTPPRGGAEGGGADPPRRAPRHTIHSGGDRRALEAQWLAENPPLLRRQKAKSEICHPSGWRPDLFFDRC